MPVDYKGFIGRILRYGFSSFTIGLMIGFIAIFRYTPIFLSFDRIEMEWAHEGNPALKDQYAVYLYEQWEKRTIARGANPFLYPGLAALLRSERYEAFESCLQRHMDEVLSSPMTLSLMENWIKILMDRHEEDDALRYLGIVEAHPFARVYLSEYLAQARQGIPSHFH